MKHKLLYIIGMAAALASCSDTWVYTPDASPYLNGEGKTPIEVTALLDAGTASAKTRAEDMKFAKDDQFVAYLRHVTWDGPVASGEPNVRTLVTADKSPCLVTFTKKSDAMTEYTGGEITPIGTNTALGLTTSNTMVASDLTATPALYWDDFSEGAQGGEKHLRTDKHYLQSYYGYCYNGGTPSASLDSDEKMAAGEIGWKVQTEQNTSDNFQNSDLLWSAEQTPIKYAHATYNGGTAHGQLVLPFTHAMSKVTINLTADAGFASEFKFTSTTVTLKNMNTVCTATAPTATLSDEGTPTAITMKQVDANTAKKATYSAIIVPTTFTEGNVFATITKADGNTYDVKVTSGMLDSTIGWGGKLTSNKTQSGVHYVLNVTLSKQKISVQALILDWDKVEATGFGEIKFDADVKTNTVTDGSVVVESGSFDLWFSKDNTSYGDKASTFTYTSAAPAGWYGDPKLYWENGSTNYYFRALAKVENPATAPNVITTVGNTAMSQGTDFLWGTTSAHEGVEADGTTKQTYDKGAAINPRTGSVPLTFEHAMSKITFKLLDGNKDAEIPAILHDGSLASPLNPHLDLSDATIQITNLATGGTINIRTGDITAGETAGKIFSETEDPIRKGFYAAEVNGAATSYTENVIKDYPVIPQTIIGDDAQVIITLNNGTTYKAQLNLCVVEDTETVISSWERSKHYIYTITLAKEEITFRALIKDWEEKKGSGNATLEWD